MCRRPIAGLVTANRSHFLGDAIGRRPLFECTFGDQILDLVIQQPTWSFQPIRAPLGMLSLYLGTLLGNATTADLAEIRPPAVVAERRAVQRTTGKCRQLCSMTRARLRSMILALGQRFTAARKVSTATR